MSKIEVEIGPDGREAPPTMKLQVGDRIVTPSGMPLIVARKFADGLILTEDGSDYKPEWDDGTGDLEWCIYYEAWQARVTTKVLQESPMKRVAHGWIDVQSRKIVQSG